MCTCVNFGKEVVGEESKAWPLGYYLNTGNGISHSHLRESYTMSAK